MFFTPGRKEPLRRFLIISEILRFGIGESRIHKIYVKLCRLNFDLARGGLGSRQICPPGPSVFFRPGGKRQIHISGAWRHSATWAMGPSSFQDISIFIHPLNECISGAWLMPGLVGSNFWPMYTNFWPMYTNFWPLYRARIPIHLGRGPKIRISICQPVNRGSYGARRRQTAPRRRRMEITCSMSSATPPRGKLPGVNEKSAGAG